MMRIARIAACLLLLSLPLYAGERSTPIKAAGKAQENAAGASPPAGGTIMGGTMIETFLKGGLMMWFILVSSILGLTISFERLFSLRQKRVVPEGLLEKTRQAVRTGSIRAAIQACDEQPSSLGRVLKVGLECFASLVPTGVTAVEIDTAVGNAMSDAASQELAHLRAPTKMIGFIATVAPLMGLLGTVFGMIKIFDVIGSRGAVGDIRDLAAGIAEALLTTAFGLLVAIPLLFIFEYFRRKAERMVRQIAQMAGDLARTVVPMAHTRTVERPELPVEAAVRQQE